MRRVVQLLRRLAAACARARRRRGWAAELTASVGLTGAKKTSSAVYSLPFDVPLKMSLSAVSSTCTRASEARRERRVWPAPGARAC
jgi:hypothetical protein